MLCVVYIIYGFIVNFTYNSSEHAYDWYSIFHNLQTKRMMASNLEKVLERGEKLEDLEIKAGKLKGTSIEYRYDRLPSMHARVQAVGQVVVECSF